MEKALCSAERNSFYGKGSYTVPGALVNFITMAGKATGYGVYNLKRDLYDGVFSEIVAATGDCELRYEMLKFFKNIDVSTNRAAFYDLLYAAKQNDSAAYRRIRKDMMDSGVKESSIEENMKKRAE